MDRSKGIWTTYLFTLAAFQLLTIGLVLGHSIQFGFSASRNLLLFFSVLIILAVPIRNKVQTKVLGAFLVADQMAMILLGVSQAGVFSPSIPSFVSLPVVIAGIWGFRAGAALLAVGVVCFAAFGVLSYFDAISFPGLAEFDIRETGLWVSIIMASGIASLIGIIVTGKLRKDWSAALQEVDNRRAETQAILDNLVDAFFRCDAKNQICQVSPSFLRLLELEETDTDLGRLPDYFTDRDEVSSFVAKLERGDFEHAHQLSTQMRTASGKHLEIELRAVPRKNNQGIFIGYEGIIRDRTELVKSETDRKFAEVQKSSVAENIPGAVYDYIRWPDGSESVEFLNSRCELIWEVSAEEAAKDPNVMRAKVFPEDNAKVQDLIEESRRTLKPWAARYRVKQRDGDPLHLDIRGNPKRYPDGSDRWHYVALDVTAEVKAQEELIKQIAVTEQAQKQESIGQLTGGVAHDFNNLLAVVLGNLELLKEESSDTEREKFIEAAYSATLRGADLTKNMLAFARRTKLDPKVLDLNTIVQRTTTWTGRTLPANIDVETSLLAGLWKLKADEGSLESALLNLIVNARDAMPSGGKLTIETSNVRIDESYLDERSETIEPGRYVMLAVSDTGTGISSEDLGRIFDPFYTTKEPGSGSGLGLSMIEGFTRQSGGAVRVYTELGVGTTFKLYFKAHTASSSSEDANKEKSVITRGTGTTVFVVEDEAGLLDVLKNILRKAGYSIRFASSGDQALEDIRRDPKFDVLVTDIVMPGTLQGTGLAHEIRKEWPDTPIVFLSGYAAEATVHGNGLRPEDIRLMKPVRSRDLLSAIEKALLNSAASKRQP